MNITQTYKEKIVFLLEHRKLIIILALFLLLITLLIFGGENKESSANASTIKEKYFTCIDIETDDTLWSIAKEYASVESGSYEDFIDEVRSINNLKSDVIYDGATLVIPIYK